jgi:hypothetical protein
LCSTADSVAFGFFMTAWYDLAFSPHPREIAQVASHLRPTGWVNKPGQHQDGEASHER